MRHIAVITKKPEKSGNYSIPDGALVGNGDLCAILGNCKSGMRIYLSKCDLWMGVERGDSGGLKPLGYIDIPIPAKLYDNYHVEQDMDKGEIRCRFAEGNQYCEINIITCKAENSVLLECSGTFDIEPSLKVFGGETSGEKGTLEADGISGIFRIFSGEDHAYETYGCAFLKKICEGKYYLFAATNHDVDNPRDYALGKVKNADKKIFNNLINTQYEAWKEFYSKSSFSLSDKELENAWYSSQYFLACCTGNKKFPPGLYANFITIENPGWSSDYHLNYNYQAPFYAACSSNHPEFTDCYHVPLEDFLEKGKHFAEKIGCRGILYPVGLAPKGLCSEMDKDNKYWFERLFMGQKSSQLHAADIMVFRWKTTKDKEYAREHAYPFIKAGLEFFEDYMIFESGRYSVCRDAAHEVPYYKKDFDPKKYKRFINDKNNMLTQGMLRLCLDAAIEMSEALEIDEEKRSKWKNILDNLSPFATYYRFFEKVFRYTEKGQAWNDGNDVGLQHIYPGCRIDLSSDPEILKIARASFRMKKECWDDDNATCSYYPMAARLGIDPGLIIKKLKELRKKHLLPNMLMMFYGGCLENCSTPASTLNEMALQSTKGTLRIFPCWDKSIDAEYKNLRTDGAFLVSSSIKEGKIGKTIIISEAGEKLRLKNPFGKTQISFSDRSYISSDEFIEAETEKGETITVEEIEEV